MYLITHIHTDILNIDVKNKIINRILVILLIGLLALPFFSGCNAKRQFVLWKTLHWEKVKDGDVSAIVIDPKNSSIVYITDVSSNKVWRSDDGGKHWNTDSTKTVDEVEKLYMQSLHGKSGRFVNPSNSQIILRETDSSKFNERSSDGGKTWEKIIGGTLIVSENPSIIYCVNDTGIIYFSLDFGKTWKRSPLPAISYMNTFAMAVNPQNPNIIYFGCFSGLFKSVKGEGNYEYYPVGNSSNVSYMFVNSNSLYAVSHDIDSFITFFSSDYGKTWQKKGGFYFNPFYPNIFIKIAKSDATALRNLYISLDNGKNWELSNLDISKDENSIYSVLITENAVYSETQSGLFKSSDKGLHWKQIDKFDKIYWEQMYGEGSFNSKIAVDPEKPNIIYWASGLSKSTDDGKTWERFNIRHTKRVYGSAVAIDPLNHSTVYIGLSGTEEVEPLSPEEHSEEGIYKSNDFGKNWERTGLKGYPISAITISPKTGIVYVGTYDNGMFMSKDSGKTWQRIPLDNDFHLSVSSIAIDSENNIVYIGVLGGGIFKIKDGK